MREDDYPFLCTPPSLALSLSIPFMASSCSTSLSLLLLLRPYGSNTRLEPARCAWTIKSGGTDFRVKCDYSAAAFIASLPLICGAALVAFHLRWNQGGQKSEKYQRRK